MKILLIGESSWDLEAFTQCLKKPDEVLLHNDYFFTSNKSNTSFFKRIITLLSVFFLVLTAIVKRKEIYFSSLNAEVLVVALMFSWYKRSNLFLPNVIGDPCWYNKRLQRCLHKYDSKIIVSDEVTYKNLRQYNCECGRKIFKFKVPDKNKIKQMKYILVLPASLSHSNLSEDKAGSYYDFSFYIFNTMTSLGYDVFSLPHPRDREYLEKRKLDLNVINSEDIKSMGDDVCYLSGHSSLSLNRRYGGKYGFWICDGNRNALHPSLSEENTTLVDIKYFEG
ncbi:hypothetical protein [Photobacterium arenosum]|uniref:hypothetical protein n=1 Tax=Photobacterium arenosum TaxID=2774143 RepID=UPI00288C56C8|nr:hypothetical protein [Photobacterium arenosum]